MATKKKPFIGKPELLKQLEGVKKNLIASAVNVYYATERCKKENTNSAEMALESAMEGQRLWTVRYERLIKKVGKT